jgi:hypothetical protein
MREIQLHSKLYPGLVAQVDDDDYELVSQYRWYPFKGHNTFYAYTHTHRADGGPTTIHMHKLVTGYPMTDHQDHDGLNCQRYNMRKATDMQNNVNRAKWLKTSSQFKGVCWDKQAGKWMARIRVNYLETNLGRFISEVEAALAYDRAAVKHHGDFACTNAMLGLLPTQSDCVLAV